MKFGTTLKWTLEAFKYKPKKIKITKFTDTELKSVSDSGLESETEIESKSELESDTK